jgi:predicted nucleotidyltransferase
MTDIPQWTAEWLAKQPYPLTFATVSGAHLYGFPSVDSDVDLRGAHLLPAREVVGLDTGPETIDVTVTHQDVEVDLVTHDLRKFCGMLLRRNGYVLEQLLSPLVVITSPWHQELLALAPGCVTRHHAHHYLGFAATQRRLFDKTAELKPLLYTFRVLLTGIHLMGAGRLEADLNRLLDLGPEYLPDLIDAKKAGEHDRVDDHPGLPGRDRLDADVVALTSRLEDARDESALPDVATAKPALHDLIVRARLA